MSKKRIQLGDIVELSIVEAGLAYVQYVNKSERWGQLVRVLKGGIYQQRPASFREIAAEKELWFAFIPIGACLSRGYVQWVAKEPIPPHAQAMPLFKAARENLLTFQKLSWWLYDGTKTWEVGKELDEEYHDCPIEEIVNLTLLEDRIATGWRPRDEMTDGPPKGLRPWINHDEKEEKMADTPEMKKKEEKRKAAVERRTLEDFPTEKGWTMRMNLNGGKPEMIRINNSALQYTGHPELPYRLGVAVPFLRPNDADLPEEDELEILGNIEDALLETLQMPKNGFLVSSITMSKMREFVFYIKSPRYVRLALEAAQKVSAEHQIQHYVKKDAQWEGYQEIRDRYL